MTISLRVRGYNAAAVAARVGGLNGAAIPLSVGNRNSAAINATVSIVETTYQERLLSFEPDYYWPLTEASGTNADEQINNADGTHSASDIAGAALGIDGLEVVPLYVRSTNDRTTLPHASLSAFDGSQGWLTFWFRIPNSADWTSGVFNYFFHFNVDGSNLIRGFKSSVNDAWGVQYMAAGTLKSPDMSSITGATTDWCHVVLCWQDSGSGNAVNAWANGEASSSNPMGSNGAFSASTLAYAMLATSTTGGANGLNGSLCHVAIKGGEVLTDDDVIYLLGNGLGLDYPGTYYVAP